MNQEDYDELRQEDIYEASGGVYSGFCMCGEQLTQEEVDGEGVCLKCQ